MNEDVSIFQEKKAKLFLKNSFQIQNDNILLILEKKNFFLLLPFLNFYDDIFENNNYHQN